MAKYFLSITFACLLFSSCKKESNPTAKAYKVTYTIGCTDCEVIYYDSRQAEQTEYHKTSSWSYTFNGKAGNAVLLLAYNTSDHPQGVTATIQLNDSVLATQTDYCPISGYSFVSDTLR